MSLISAKKLKKIIPYAKKKSSRFYNAARFYVRNSLGISRQLSTEKKLFGGYTSKSELMGALCDSLVCLSRMSPLRKSDFSPKFSDAVKEHSDAFMSDRFYILFEYKSGMVDSDSGHCKWYTDFETGYRYKNSHCYKTRKVNNISGVDIKNVWEMSRLQYLVAPSLQWRISGESRYAEKVRAVLLDWIECNPYEEGPNWNVAMEVGIRAVNMLVAFVLISDNEAVTADDAKKILASLYLHMRYIYENLESFGERTYNHYIGDLIGILAVGALLRNSGNGNKYFAFARAEFEKEIAKQFHGDGGSVEGSACYHGLVGEMFSLAAIICENAGCRLSEEYTEMLKKTVAFSLNTENAPSSICQIGDNDSGRCLCIAQDEPLDYSFFRKAASFACGCSGETDIIGLFGNENAVAKGNDAASLTEGWSLFSQTGIAAFHRASDGFAVVFAATEPQKLGWGGHAHNDKLSVNVSYGGKLFICDAGSGCYTSNHEISKSFRSVKCHSTVSVCGGEQNLGQSRQVFGNSHEARVLSLSVNGNDAFGEIEVASKYTHKRSIRIKENRCVINDSVAVIGERKGEYEARFMLHPSVVVKVDGKNVLLINGESSITISADASFTVEKSLYSPCYGKWCDTHILIAKYAKPDLDTTIILNNN